MSIRLIGAGRNRLFCECLAYALSQIEGFRATYHLCEEIPVATQRIFEECPDVLLVAVHFGAEELIELTSAVAAEGQKVLVVGAENREQAAAVTAAGAMAYTWQETSIDELVGLIGMVREGERVVPGQGEE